MSGRRNLSPCTVCSEVPGRHPILQENLTKMQPNILFWCMLWINLSKTTKAKCVMRIFLVWQSSKRQKVWTFLAEEKLEQSRHINVLVIKIGVLVCDRKLIILPPKLNIVEIRRCRFMDRTKVGLCLW